MRFDSVLFDLDGTLLYTLPDMRAALNRALALNGFPERTLPEVRSFVGNGVRKLIERAVPEGDGNPRFEAVWQEYNTYYALHGCDTTAPYPGVPELLDALRTRGVRTAVVTNKTHSDAEPMIRRFFGDRIGLTGGKTPEYATKPAPDSLLAALAALGTVPARALYVGDSGVDAQTARNAQVACVLAAWGYWDRDRLEACPALGLISAPAELLTYLE